MYHLLRKIYSLLEEVLGFCYFCKKYTGKQLYNCCQETLENPNNKLDFPTYVPFSYENNLVMKAILQFKYNYNFHAGYFLAKQVSNLIKFNNIVFIPVPLDKKRLLFRGYNQSYILCKYMQTFLGGRIENCCYKNVNLTQKDGTIMERYVNSLSIKLKYEPSINKDENILIVDDVIASGHTINAIANLLSNYPVNLCSVAIT